MASTPKHIIGWPESSITSRSGEKRFKQTLINIFLLLLTILFFIYADLVRRSDHLLSDSPLVRNLDEVSRYGPTIFPILFTLVVGGSLRSLALYRLQVGEKIGVLDLLFGSTTLGSSLETLLERHFRYFDITTVGLLLLWALSPLGGQATLRVIGYHDTHSTSPLQLAYMDYIRSTFPRGLQSGDLGGNMIPSSSALLSSLSSPMSLQASKSDLWGNVKIPVLEGLPEYQSAGSSDWVNVPINSTEVRYASLIGLPVANIPQIGHTQFRAEVAYWDLECPSFREGTQQDVNYTLSLLPKESASYLEVTAVNTRDLQGATSTWGWILSNNSANSLKQRCDSNPTNNPPRRQLMYRSWNAHSGQTVANCSIGTSHVEVSIECNGMDCGVDRMRRSQQHPELYSTAYTSFDSCHHLPNTGNVVVQFFYLLLMAVDSQLKRATQSGILQSYIQHPSHIQGNFDDIELNSLGNDTFAQRFPVLLNTYWSAIYNYNLTFNGHDDTLLFDDTFYFEDPTAKTTGATTISERRFVYNRGWFPVLVISSTILFATAFCKLILDLFILIPNLQMNVSTLLRGNMSHCPSTPNGGSAMDDRDRSRLLRHHKVRFGYRPGANEDAGELGLGELEEEEGSVRRVIKGEKYY